MTGAPPRRGVTGRSGPPGAGWRSPLDRAAAQICARFGWGVAAPTPGGPLLVLLSGLPGTGKSFLAAAIAAQHPVLVLRSDEVRKALFVHPSYTGRESGIVYLTCALLLRTLLAGGHAVVFDATNLSRDSRRRRAPESSAAQPGRLPSPAAAAGTTGRAEAAGAPGASGACGTPRTPPAGLAAGVSPSMVAGSRPEARGRVGNA